MPSASAMSRKLLPAMRRLTASERALSAAKAAAGSASLCSFGRVSWDAAAFGSLVFGCFGMAN